MVVSNDSLANLNHQLNMHFKYHSESAQTIYSSKETKKSYRQACINQTTVHTAVCPRPLYNIHKFGTSSYQARHLTQQDI
jgi:hypothetical protein